MRQTNHRQARFLCCQCLMMFQFAGNVEVGFLGNDEVNDFAARAGTYGGCFD
ncbi:MAG: hypothetical protein ABSH16_07170 [Sedimentisphaerales bacterium]